MRETRRPSLPVRRVNCFGWTSLKLSSTNPGEAELLSLYSYEEAHIKTVMLVACTRIDGNGRRDMRDESFLIHATCLNEGELFQLACCRKIILSNNLQRLSILYLVPEALEGEHAGEVHTLRGEEKALVVRHSRQVVPSHSNLTAF